MKLRYAVLLLFILIASAFASVKIAGGQVRRAPQLLNYQGFLTDSLNNPITDPSFSLTFAIFDAETGGNMLWSERQTVDISRGIFSVLLGDVNPIPVSVFLNGTDRWLELGIGEQALAPRTRFTAVPYAYTANYADSVGSFPRPAYNSGWQPISQAANLILTHDLGGDPDDYLVDLQFKDNTNGFGVHHAFYGGDADNSNYYGTFWRNLTNTQITVYRRAQDVTTDSVRVRIWVVE